MNARTQNALAEIIKIHNNGDDFVWVKKLEAAGVKQEDMYPLLHNYVVEAHSGEPSVTGEWKDASGVGYGTVRYIPEMWRRK